MPPTRTRKTSHEERDRFDCKDEKERKKRLHACLVRYRSEVKKEFFKREDRLTNGKLIIIIVVVENEGEKKIICYYSYLRMHGYMARLFMSASKQASKPTAAAAVT